MNTYVSFLRGINVGGRQIKMKDLRVCYETAGFKDILTFLQSGNVLFKSNLKPNQIENILEFELKKKFKFELIIILVSIEKLENVFKNYPFSLENNNLQNYIIFMKKDKSNSLFKEGSLLNSKIDKITYSEDIIYWQVVKGMSVKSPFSKLINKNEYKKFNTIRNIRTISKIID